MKFTSVAIALAAAGLASAGHHHGRHVHHHQRDVKDVVYEFVMEDGQTVPVSKACELLDQNVVKVADGVLPAGACVSSSAVPSSTSTATPTPTSTATPTTAAAELLQQSASISTLDPTTSSSTPTPTPSPDSTSSSTTSSTETVPASTSSAVSSSSSSSSSTPVSSGSTTGGGVTIQNNSPHTLYMWIFDSPVAPPMETLPAGQSLGHSWRINPDGGGVSIKVSTVPDISNVVQYEYTVSGDTIFWDLSLINMNLLEIVGNLLPALGFQVTSPQSSCMSVTCEAGIIQCPGAYLFPADNRATHGCPVNTNMVFEIGL